MIAGTHITTTKKKTKTLFRKCTSEYHEQVTGDSNAVLPLSAFDGYHKECKKCRVHKRKLRRQKEKIKQLTELFPNEPAITKHYDVIVRSWSRDVHQLVAEAKVYDQLIQYEDVAAYYKTDDELYPAPFRFGNWFVYVLSAERAREICKYLIMSVEFYVDVIVYIHGEIDSDTRQLVTNVATEYRMEVYFI